MRNPNEKKSRGVEPEWETLLLEAVTKPGLISSAYTRFWNYSVGNQILAMIQCLERGIASGPIHTFRGWLELGRHVKKGERAITLCMPVTIRRKCGDDMPEAFRPGDGAERQVNSSQPSSTKPSKDKTATVFTYRPHWFVLAQTEGDPYCPQELPMWSETHALHTLLIDRVSFTHPNGNCQGFAIHRSVAVSPIAALPHKTLFHEVAHVLLGHTEEYATLDDHERTPMNLREVEAECVALICCESLNLPGAVECRGYIQHWLGTETIPDRSAKRIFKAADQILKAGRPDANPDERADTNPATPQ